MLTSKQQTKSFANILIAVGLLSLGSLVGCDNAQEDKKSSDRDTIISIAHRVKVCKVFIENSGSMDGYVQAVNSQLKTDLNALISQIETSTDSLSLNYINSNIIPIDCHSVSNFTEGLSLRNFQTGGGNRTDTSLQDVLKQVYDATPPDGVSILVSDMILSLKSGQSPESVSVNIETDLRRQLRHYPNWSIVVWRMLSDYEGKYYHDTGVPSVKLSGIKRPYYIIFFGNRHNLHTLLGEGKLHKNASWQKNLQQTLSLEPKYSPVNHYISPRAILGKIRLDTSDKSSQTIAQAERGSQRDNTTGLSFEVVYKRPDLLQSLDNLMDATNYEVKPAHYSVVGVYPYEDNIKVRLHSANVVRGSIEVLYRQPFPLWIAEVHCEQNRDIYADQAIQQTYGIRYILEGLQRPYEVESQHLLHMPISIK